MSNAFDLALENKQMVFYFDEQMELEGEAKRIQKQLIVWRGNVGGVGLGGCERQKWRDIRWVAKKE